MIKIKEFIQKAKAFINENPQRKKLLLIIFVLAVIPLTVLAALTAQNLIQKASISEVVRISDQGGNTLSSTSDSNVYIDINLSAAPQWKLPEQPSAHNGLIKQAYALTCIDFCLDDGESTYAECQAQCTPAPTATPIPVTQTIPSTGPEMLPMLGLLASGIAGIIIKKKKI